MNLLKKYETNKYYVYRWLPWVFLLFALPITYAIWNAERKAEYNDREVEFNYRLANTHNQIAEQLTLHEQSLYSIRGFFNASSFVDADEFSDYVQTIFKSKFSSGLYQVGFVKYVDLTVANSDQSLEANLKNLLIKRNNAEQHDSYAPVVYAVSQTNNIAVRKLSDAFDIPQAKQAMLQSANLNQAVIINKINLEASAMAGCECLSMVLPIYASPQQNSFPLKNLNEINGWVFLTIDSKAFFKQTIGNLNDEFITYSVFDGATDNGTNLLYRDGKQNINAHFLKPSYMQQKIIDMSGHEWLIKAQSLPKFDGMLNFHNPNVIGAIGLFTNFAIAGVLLLLFARLKALDELKHTNQQLQFSDNRWRFALEGSGDGVWDWDVRSRQVTFSKRWKEMLGYEERDLDNTFETWQSKIHPDNLASVMNAVDATLAGQTTSYSIECRFKCKDDSWKWMLARGMVVIKDDDGLPLRLVGTQTDISQLKDSEETIWQHANFDALTNLPNRRMFYARLDQELSKSKRTKLKFGLLFLDLDRFKEVNDTLGHDQGDVLLQLAAQRLLDCTYEQDVVARLGGDEFVILVSDIENIHLKNLEVIAQKVLSTLAEPFLLNHEKAFVSASIGIAIYPDDSSNTDDLIKCVDQAMYESKHRGGNCFTYFTTKMQEKAVNRLHLSNDLRGALSKDELFIEYQPIIELKTSKIYKAEALLRWLHPERGLISPAEFIPIAEDTRLINEIGHWVLIESIKQCMDWRKKIDSSFQITVNKSPVQFLNTEEKYSNWVKTLLKEENSVNAIVIEITESLLLDASGHMVDKLKRYRQNGIQFALDDFGTGYSSLSYLRKFEIDYLKIDRSFVANIHHNVEDKVLCTAIITMAHSLGIKVIAEGIETQEQRDILLQLGCDFGQGFYFSKSLLPAQFEAYLDAQKPALTPNY